MIHYYRILEAIDRAVYNKVLKEKRRGRKNEILIIKVIE